MITLWESDWKIPAVKLVPVKIIIENKFNDYDFK